MGLPVTHATTLSAFINQFEKCLDDKLSHQKSSVTSTTLDKDLVGVLGKSLEFFDDVVVREQIYRLNIRKVQLKEEIEKLEAIKSELDIKAAKRNKLFFTSASLFFTL